MKDFQRGWYMQLMLLCAVSQRPGYIASTERLWELAGAHRRDFWELHKSAVMACFKTRTIDGTEWIYNERLLHTIEHQHRKLSKSLELHNTHKNVSVSKVSLKPSLEEVKNYCKERNNQINADEWYSHYEANGWRVGRVAMKDWKAAVRTWEARNYGTNRQHGKESRAKQVADNNLAAFAAAMGSNPVDFGAVSPQRADYSRDQTLAGEVKRLPE